MIRRDEIGPDGRPMWFLIDQVEHATLAGHLAEQWRLEAVLFGDIRSAWLPAVFHHDDGWAEWDAGPELDSAGKPVNFNEMPTVEAMPIWRRSVAAGRSIGPLAEYTIAGHFRALLLRFDSWRKGETPARQAAEHFLQFAEARMAAALADWQSPSERRTASVAELALHLLQFFDALSLWFCCQRRMAAEKFSVPACGDVTFSPAEPAVTGTLATIAVAPWPFATAELDLAVPARVIPEARFAGQRLAPAQAPHAARLEWRLVER